MKTNFFSQLAIPLTGLEESIEETMYFSLASAVIGESVELKELPLPSFLLGEVRHVATSPLYFEYNKNRKEKVLNHFPRYANYYSLIKLTASWEEFMLECIIVMEMAKTADYTLKNEIIIRKDLRDRGIGHKSGTGLLKELDKLYQLEVAQAKEFEVIASIYKLRDCIAHRDGVISRWDLDKNGNFMNTVWKKAIVKEKKQSLSAWTLAGKSKFETVIKDEKKQWFENQVIVLGDKDICDIGLSFIEIGSIVFNRLVNYGKANNIR
jgi:hypothetical protein